jgi:ABC-type antimicrobial peptide transport system permease subunit
MKVRTLRKQFSILRAIGAQPRSLLSAFLMDTFIGMILGAIVGSFVGFLLTTIILQMPLTYLGLSTDVSWDRLPLFITTPWSLLIGIVSLALTFSIIISLLVMRRGLESNIAEDIQHSE